MPESRQRSPQPSRPPMEQEGEEPGRLHWLGWHVATLVDDLPFIPLKPYEHRWLQIGWRSAVLVVLAVIAFAPSLRGEWLWHDEALIGDLAVRSTSGLGRIWAHPFAVDVSPAARTLAWLELHVLGQSPATFRAVSMTLHATACLFGWWVMRRLNVPGAWLAAAVVALHPIALPTVAWLSRQGDLLAAAMSAMAVWAYLVTRQIRPFVNERIWTDPAYHDDEDRAPRWPWPIVVLAGLIALATGSAVPVLAAAGVLAAEANFGELTRRRAGVLAAVVAVAIAARVVLPHGASATVGLRSAPPVAAATEAAAALPWTMLHAAVPLDVPLIHDRLQWAGLPWMIAAGLVTLLCLVLPLWRWRRTWPAVLTVAALFTVVHGATVGRPHAAAVVATDLLPYGGGAVLLATAVALFLSFVRRRTREPADRALRWGIGVAVLSVLGVVTFCRAGDYTSADTLWQRALALNPESIVAREALAERYLAEDYIEEAGLQLDRVPASGQDVTWLLARGRIYDAQKRYSEAVTCYESAHRQQAGDITTTIALAEAHANAGQPERTAELYADLLTHVTTDANLFTNAGLAQMRLRRPDAAIGLYNAALQVDDAYIPAHVNLANALFETGKYPEAAEHLQRVVALDPRNYVAFVNAGVMLYRLGDPAKAERMFRGAVHLNPKSADAYRKLAASLTAQKKDAEAAWCTAQASRVESTTNAGR